MRILGTNCATYPCKADCSNDFTLNSFRFQTKYRIIQGLTDHAHDTMTRMLNWVECIHFEPRFDTETNIR